MAVVRSSSGWVTQSQGEGAILEVFFPVEYALYSIAFETHTKTAEPIEVPFGLMTPVGSRYYVLDEGPDPQRKGQYLGANVTAHCKVMGHYGALKFYFNKSAYMINCNF